MNHTWVSIFSSITLFLSMLGFYETGYRIGRQRRSQNGEDTGKGSGALEAAVFGLLGLLLAFTFSGAASRFEDRRHLIAEEANAIGTAYLRLDLLAPVEKAELQPLFARYVDNRVTVYQGLADPQLTTKRLAESASLQNDIWSRAVNACRQPGAMAQAAMLLLPALNSMIDITTTRTVATQNHPPVVIFILLVMLSLVSALLAGYDSSASEKPSRLYTLIFAVTMSLTLYVILDLEYPRLGLIRIDSADQLMIDLRKTMP